jgi:hypothetical protein
MQKKCFCGSYPKFSVTVKMYHFVNKIEGFQQKKDPNWLYIREPFDQNSYFVEQMIFFHRFGSDRQGQLPV